MGLIWLPTATPEMSKETLVMLPGMMCDSRLFAPQISALETEYEIIVPLLDVPDSIEGMARRILNEIKPPAFNLLGLSMGGIVAMSMVELAPQRVRRLALLDTNHKADSDERVAIRNRQISNVKSGKLRAVITDEMKPVYLAKSHRKNQALLNLLVNMAMDMGDEIFVAQSIALRDRRDQTQTLPNYFGPSLVLCGDEDTLCPPGQHIQMAEYLSHSTFRMIENCGHISTLEQPEAVNIAVLEWLTLAVTQPLELPLT
jgi:pimeloyl-ACP methyl ester carboxylesterase